MAKIQIGDKFGRLTVIAAPYRRFANSNSTQLRTFIPVKCECGNEREIQQSLWHKTKSCGCFWKETITGFNRKIDLTGHVFGRLTVIEFSHINKRSTYWKCKCACGNTTLTPSSNLRRKGKHTVSCGCFQREQMGDRQRTHGLSKHPLFSVWSGIIDRCENKNSPSYEHYGAKGVMVCDEWRTDFKSFYDWCMANGWRKNLQIDRFPNRKGNYEPSNCRCATPKQNIRNKDSTKLNEKSAAEIRQLLPILGVTKLAKMYNVSNGAIHGIRLGKTWQ